MIDLFRSFSCEGLKSESGTKPLAGTVMLGSALPLACTNHGEGDRVMSVGLPRGYESSPFRTCRAVDASSGPVVVRSFHDLVSGKLGCGKNGGAR